MTNLPLLREAVAKMTPDDYAHLENNVRIAKRNGQVVASFAVVQAESVVAEVKRLRAALPALLDEVEALKDDICMVVNRKPLDPDEDHDKNLLAIVALLDEVEALKARLQHYEECADTPLMRTVQKELEAARIENARLRAGIKAWEDKEAHEGMSCYLDNEQLKADLAAARAVLDTAIEHTDEFGAVTVRVEPLAYDAWVERQRADQA
jgi:hypothetical protein